MSMRHLIMGRGLMVLTVVCFCWQVVQQVALSQTLPEEDPGHGVLMLGKADEWTPAILLETRLDVQVNGPIANITLSQDFFNSYDNFAEASYLFPMPEQAAIYAMQIQIDERVINGSIAEKQVAEVIYNQARAAGQQAAITQQLSGNIFRTRVAHIGSGQSIQVTLQYRQVLEPHNGRFSLRLPTTISPRYQGRQVPVEAQAVLINQASGRPPAWTAEVVSASDLPIENINLFSLALDLNAGLELAELSSSSHDITVLQQDQRYQVSLADQFDLMDRDVVIEWEPLATTQPQLVALRESRPDSGGEFGLLMLIPPQKTSPQSNAGELPREMIFVLDRSGSMGGELMRQASASVVFALQQLSPQDRFNIIDFSDDAQRWAPQTRFGNAANVSAAVQYVEQLQAGGGTNIADALHTALSLPETSGWLRQVVFITDGSVADEAGVLRMINTDLGEARLFTVGIGYAPNSFFMRKAAELGRGTQHMIGDLGEVKPQMQALLSQLRHPVLRDIEMQLPAGLSAEHYPAQLPDLYFGEPLLIAARFEHWPEWLQLEGFDGLPWSQRLQLRNVPAHSQGIASLWARAKMTELMDGRYQGGDADQIRAQVVELALEHQLLSEYTSFVAVEQQPVNPDPDSVSSASVANLMPRGMSFPQGGNGLYGWYLLGGLALLLFLFSHAGRVVQVTHRA